VALACSGLELRHGLWNPAQAKSIASGRVLLLPGEIFWAYPRWMRLQRFAELPCARRAAAEPG